MVHVAKEMQRLGYQLPLLIGGATTSPAHTAVKIDPHYAGAVIYVKDASRSVGVCQQLITGNSRDAFIAHAKAEHERRREQHRNKGAKAPQMSLAQARARKLKLDWADYMPPAPAFVGVRIFEDYPLAELVSYIDWMPFFNAWEFAGKFPDILRDPIIGEAATNLYADARRMLERLVAEKWLRARAVVGFFPANSVGDDDIEVYTDERRQTATLAPASFAPAEVKTTGSAAAVSVGLHCACAKRPRRLHRSVCRHGRDRHRGARRAVRGGPRRLQQHHAQIARGPVGGGPRGADARTRSTRILGICGGEQLTGPQLLREEYQGIRPAPGYPACPDHTEKATLWQLLDAERSAGIRLTESFAMWPTAAVSGWYFSHPRAHYFGVGQIDRDQVASYAQRKGMPLSDAERWLAPNLGYDPAGGKAADAA